MFREDPNERIEYARTGAVPGVEVLSGYNCVTPWHTFHERYDVCAVEHRSAEYHCRHRMETFVGERVVLTEPGEMHRTRFVGTPGNFKVLMIEPDEFHRISLEMGRSATPHFKYVQATDSRFFGAIYGFCAAVDAAESTLELQARFAACMRLLLECLDGAFPQLGPVHSSAIGRVKHCLLERYSEAVTLTELAAVADLSRFHLVRAFHREVGLPPHAFQLHVRIERAQSLLRKGMLPVDAAASVGFADQSHFTRHFKRILGITPGAYTRLWRRPSAWR